MTEKTINQDSLTCSKCGLEIGRLITVEDETLMQVGGLVVRDIDGCCAQCGNEFHYSLNARRLEKLIKRIKEREAAQAFGHGTEGKHDRFRP